MDPVTLGDCDGCDPCGSGSGSGSGPDRTVATTCCPDDLLPGVFHVRTHFVNPLGFPVDTYVDADVVYDAVLGGWTVSFAPGSRPPYGDGTFVSEMDVNCSAGTGEILLRVNLVFGSGAAAYADLYDFRDCSGAHGFAAASGDCASASFHWLNTTCSAEAWGTP